jgi:dTDP-4-amino-4,6-dideoxygalactose transaminase
MKKFTTINLIEPNITEAEIEAVTRVLKTGMLVNGPVVERFEQLLAEYTGVAHAVCVSSGTAALHLALLGLDIKIGDEVIVPAFTFPATANVVELLGARPVFVDCKPGGINLDVNKLVGKIGARTKAIIPVHAFGIPADMDAILEVSRQNNQFVIEDAACALGSKYKNNLCGAIGDLGIFSFHPRKLLTTGEGGAVVTNNKRLADKIKIWRNHGYQKGKYDCLGLNYRMTDFQAAMGVAQLERYTDYISTRQRLAQIFQSMIDGIEWIKSIDSEPMTTWNVQTFLVKVTNNIIRDELIKYLNSRGIESTIGTYCVPLIQYYRTKYGFKPDHFPEAYHNYKNSLSLPLHNNMSDQDMARVIEMLISFEKMNKG